MGGEMELFLVATLVSQCSHNTLIMVSVDVDKKSPNTWSRWLEILLG